MTTFETQYLPQMGGDAFLRPIIMNDRLGETAPLRGQTPKVPRPQKYLNAIYLSYVFWFFFKFSDVEEDLSIYEISRSDTAPQSKEARGDENKKILLWGVWSPNLTPDPQFL